MVMCWFTSINVIKHMRGCSQTNWPLEADGIGERPLRGLRIFLATRLEERDAQSAPHPQTRAQGPAARASFPMTEKLQNFESSCLRPLWVVQMTLQTQRQTSLHSLQREKEREDTNRTNINYHIYVHICI